MAIPQGWAQKSANVYTYDNFLIGGVLSSGQYRLDVNTETGTSNLYRKRFLQGDVLIARSGRDNDWSLVDNNIDDFLSTLPIGKADKNTAPEYFANNFTLKLNQYRANAINAINPNIGETKIPGVNNVPISQTPTKPVVPPGAPAPSTGFNPIDIANNIREGLNIIGDPLSGAEDLAKGFDGNEAKLFSNFLLTYPNDMVVSQQDTLQITQYRYKAPQESVFTTNNFDQIAKEGLVRGTDYKQEVLGNVILPMPNKVADSNNVSWGGDNFNSLSAAVASEISNNMKMYGGGFLLGQTTQMFGSPVGGNAVVAGMIAAKLLGNVQNQNIKTSFGTGLVSTIAGAAGYEVSPETILARGFGIIPNSNLELLFGGPQLRQFTFAYRLSPRSETEAKAIRNIVRFFKQGMAARKRNDGNNFFLSTPNIFKLKYTYNGKNEIAGVNKIKTCALSGFAVDYSPDGQWAAYDQGQPASITMSMSFQELEPIYNTDYNAIPDDSVGF